MLRRLGRSREEAEDLIHDAYVRMREYSIRGGVIHLPENFLVRTALRLAINARRDAHGELYVDQNVDALAGVVDRHPTPDEVLAAEECLVRIGRVLDAVSRRAREVFFMHRLGGLSYSQIARQMNLSVSTIEKDIAAARTVVRAKAASYSST